MIDINLIPVALRKNGKGDSNALSIKIPQEVLVGVGVGVVFLVLMVHLVLGLVWLGATHRLASYNASWQQVLPDKTKLDSMNQEIGDLKRKYTLIAGMTTDKTLLWAPKFNAISNSLPKGLWIKKMTLDKVGLTIEGSVVSKSQNEINNVGMFLSSLKQNEEFMKGFSSLEENSIQGGKNNTVEVTDFSVMAKLKDEPKLK